MKTLFILLLIAMTLSQVNWSKCSQEKMSEPSNLDLPWRLHLNHLPQKPKIINYLECANVSVPVNWLNPTGPKITFHLYRMKANTTRAGQLWLLNGGPGGDGRSMAYYFGAKTHAAMGGKYDIIIPDHRGTGFSSRLSCPQESNPDFMNEPRSETFPGPLWRGCIEWVKQNNHLSAYTITEAAHDVFKVSRMLQVAGERTLLYGVSYGTMLAHRVLQIYPNSFEAMFLDGICPPHLCMIMTYDEVVNRNGLAFFNRCKDDVFCREKMPRPFEILEDITNQLTRPTKCLEIYQMIANRPHFKMMISNYLSNAYLRMLVLPLYTRMHRCSAADIPIIKHFLSKVGKIETKKKAEVLVIKSSTTHHPGDSMMLAYNIMMSEMLFHREAYSLEQILRYHNVSSFSVLSSVGPMRLHYNGLYPKYPLDRWSGRFAHETRPSTVLLLNGDLDHATPLDFAQYLAKGMNLPPTNLVRIPNGPHALLFSGEQEECALEIGVSFLLNNTVNKQCIENIKPLDWKGESEVIRNLATHYFGQAQMWD